MMDEIEYKLNTNNSVLIVNAVDKLISAIKSKFKLTERQKFVVENEELKFLRDKCSSKDSLVSLTACQGLLALVQLGVLEIGHTMSTVVTLLPSAHNYSAIISTIAGLLTLDLRSRLVPGQAYSCQFSVTSPKHPFITVLERNKEAENEVILQMHALCNHPDYIISSNSLELLRPVFLWLMCESTPTASLRPWQLLLSLPQSAAQTELLLSCLTYQQICNPTLIERSLAAYSIVTEAAVYQRQSERVVALLPMLARISNQLVRYGHDPRSCYSLMERCTALDAPELRNAFPLTVSLLAENLVNSSALHLHELFNLCLNIISKYECSAMSINIFVSLSLQWLHLPSYLTTAALKVASKIVDHYRQSTGEDIRLYMANLINNKTFESFLYTDGHLTLIFKVHEIWERIRDNPKNLKSWFQDLETLNEDAKLELLPFFLGIMMEKRKERGFEEIVIKTVDILTQLVNDKKQVSVQVLPVLLYRIANDPSPLVKMLCLKALPIMAKTKENVPTIVAILNKIKLNKGVPTSFLIMLYTSLSETQVRCFPYLQELLVDTGVGRPDDLKWEIDIAKAMSVKRICEIRASTHGLELVSVISSILNKCTDKAGSVATCLALEALVYLWRGAAVAPPSTWRALEPKLGRDGRPGVQISICKLLSEVPALRVSTPEYDKLIASAARKLWSLLAESNHPAVVEAACDALSNYKIDDYKLADVPEIYRRTVKLPASYCKTPADAARRPEDVLDYIPCEIWPEVFKYSNQGALEGVVRFTSKLVEREVRQFRSGVYQPPAGAEPPHLGYLQPTSVLRGLTQYFRTHVTSPSFDCPEAVVLAILTTLTSEYPKPLPPMDLCFLHELYHRGSLWKAGCVKLAARQANTSGSARRFLDNHLQGLGSCSETLQESDVILFYEILPILCRAMPPNTLRPILDRTLAESFAEIANIKTVDQRKLDGVNEDQYMFVKQMRMIKECLESEKIHDANRTLLSQTVEKYFSVVPDDNLGWATYEDACTALSTKYLERMTSPSGWWEVEGGTLRKAARVRCAVAVNSPTPLVWLNDIIDAAHSCYSEHEITLKCMVHVFKTAKVEDKSTSEWLLQLMARTQVAFNELEDLKAKLYLCSVLMLSIAVWGAQYTAWGSNADPRTLLPPAAAAIASSPHFENCVLPLIEWLRHTRDGIGCAVTSLACQRALVALRHASPFINLGLWKKLESHAGKGTLRTD